MCDRPRNVQRLASTFLHEAVQINVGNPDELSVNKDIVQHLYGMRVWVFIERERLCVCVCVCVCACVCRRRTSSSK